MTNTAASVKTGATVRVSGPFFAGTAYLTDQMGHDVQEALAVYALQRAVTRMEGSFKHSTGYYQRHVVLDRSKQSTAITDQGVVYGPWLEGTESRNETTRFKGYASFRKATQDANDRAVAIAEEVISGSYIKRLNG